MDSEAPESVAASALRAIREGDTTALNRLLEENRSLAGSRPDGKRTLLHVATDWPGHFPNNGATVSELIAQGANVNAVFAGVEHSETPLHWAASTDDAEVIEILLDAGADMEASGGVIGGGTPLADAVAFGQWRAARKLVERGAKTTLWQAAALGLMDRVSAHFAGGTVPGPEEVTNAFWCACHGGQQVAAEFLLDRGAELNWVGHDGLTPLDAARRAGAGHLVAWLMQRGATSNRS